MSPELLLDSRVMLWLGDVRQALDAMDPDSVDCVVTSPPYWGLRDYGVEGQIGLEPTLAEHLSIMVDVFRLVRRVLKPYGTLWINYGDCYATSPNGRSAAECKVAGADDRTFRDKPFSTVGPIYVPDHEKNSRVGSSGNRGSVAGDHSGRIVANGYLKPKDLCMVPNRLAIALQDDGWWVRSEIIWGKTNPMPDSSGAYRPSSAHEKIFLLTKSGDADVWRARDTGEISFSPDLSERCGLITAPEREGARWIRLGSYYDAEAVRQGRTSDEDANGYRGGSYTDGTPGPRTITGNRKVKMPDGWDTGPGGHGSIHRAGREPGKQIRGRETYGRHVLNDALPAAERRDKQRGHSRRHQGFNDRWDAMDKVDQMSGGRLLRNYEPAPLSVWPMATQPFRGAHFATFPADLAARCIIAGCPPGGLVLDPFGGAGTTAIAALRLGRRAALIEINPEYAALTRERIEREWSGAAGRVRTPARDGAPLPLFGEGAQ